MPDYDKVGLLVLRDNRILLCRKRQGTQLLILPGGKFDPGETSMQCLERESREELGAVSAVSPEYLGTYEYEAADPGKTLRIELWRGELDGQPEAQSEIAELVWFSPSDDRAALSPMLRDVILPDLSRRGILSE